MTYIRKIGIVSAAAVLALPFVNVLHVKSAAGPQSQTFYDSYFEYKLATPDGYVIDEWSPEYESTLSYVQPEVEEAEKPETIPVYCIENHYYGVDSNIVIPESSNQGCGFASLGDSSNASFYTADASKWNGFNAVISDYRGPDLAELVIPEYLNDGTRVVGVNINSWDARRQGAYNSGVESLVIPASVKTVFLDSGVFPKLQKVTSNSPACKTVDGVLYSADMTQLILYPAECRNEKCVIPEGVMYLAGFNGNQYLKEITIPSTLENHNDFLAGTNIEKINIAAGNPAFTDEDGIIYETQPNGVKVLLMYPSDKKDTSFTVPAGVVTSLSAFKNNPYLEELTLGSINTDIFSTVIPGDLPKLKAFHVDESLLNETEKVGLASFFELDGVLYVQDDSSVTGTPEEKAKAGAQLFYYPPGKTDEFFELPAGAGSSGRVYLNDHVKAVYVHEGSSLITESPIKYMYFEGQDYNSDYNQNAMKKFNVTLDEAKADYEAAKSGKTPEPEKTAEPEQSAEPEKTPEVTPAPAPEKKSGGSGLLVGGVVAAAAIAAGVYGWLKTKKKQ